MKKENYMSICETNFNYLVFIKHTHMSFCIVLITSLHDVTIMLLYMHFDLKKNNNRLLSIINIPLHKKDAFLEKTYYLSANEQMKCKIHSPWIYNERGEI